LGDDRVKASSAHHPWLARYAALTAVATLGLICVGGLVTSHGAGMAVPDWPTTFGYNMFFFPISKWVGGIFYEHTHRLVAAGVGFMTVVLAAWLWVAEQRRWLKWLGAGAVATVILQGVLGGLRVTALKDEIGIFHAALAQLFLVLVSAIALFISRWWKEADLARLAAPDWKALRNAYALGTGLIFVQLVLGATMRHQHAGLAIPDFPLAYGKLWPATDAASIARYNQWRAEATGLNPITASGVALQMAHRFCAASIAAAVVAAVWVTRRRVGPRSALRRLAWGGLVLIGLQVALGAGTIWTNKSADIATAHVAVGALSLVGGAMLLLTAYRCAQGAGAAARRAPHANVTPALQGCKIPA
jgi:cytochrome c oxidase assembly protein subunit 15